MLLSHIFYGQVEMIFGLVHASYSLPKGQAIKLTFLAPTIQKYFTQSPKVMQYILQRECVVQCSLNYKCKSWVVQNTSVYFYLGVCCIKMYYIFFQCETNLKRHQWMYLIELASKVTAVYANHLFIIKDKWNILKK